MRINRYVATATGLSRRAADAAVAAGRVVVDGQTAVTGLSLDEHDAADVTLDGQPLSLPVAHRYIMLNKPVGYVSSRVRQGGSPTVYDLLPPNFAELKLVGRLDLESSGLLLLSDDGKFIYRLTHPSAHKTKVYRLKLAKPLSAADAAALARGVQLEDGPSRFKVLDGVGSRNVTVELHEGRNRQIRRTIGALGNGVLELKRVAMGSYQLGELAPGEWRDIENVAEAGEPRP